MFVLEMRTGPTFRPLGMSTMTHRKANFRTYDAAMEHGTRSGCSEFTIRKVHTNLDAICYVLFYGDFS